jgi:hypothetical protein
MWSTLSHWFQHMPALPKLLLKTSNIHNFWSVAPKIMKFVLMWSLFQDAFGKRNSKNLKIVWNQTTLPKTGLAPVGPIRPFVDYGMWGLDPTHYKLALHYLQWCWYAESDWWCSYRNCCCWWVEGHCTDSHKVTVSIPAFDLFPHPMITPICTFQLTYFCTRL